MARYRPYSYEQTELIPVCFAHQIQPGTFEYALNHIVDHELDLGVFESKYRNDETGAPAYDPAIMLKVVLYAYSRGIIHSRQIARACEENVVFMALSAHTKPHFTTIAGFVSSMKEQIVPLFRDVVALCYTQGLISNQMFAIDGCKLRSNCSKEWSGTRAEFERKRRKIEDSIRFLVGTHRMHDERDVGAEAGRSEKQAVETMKAKLKKITDWLDEHPDDKRGSRGNPRQSNIIDNESAKMPTSHGVVQGYIGVAAVDAKHQVVVHASVHGESHEAGLLAPAIEGIRQSAAHAGVTGDVLRTATVVADTGYHSEENVKQLLEQGIDAVIADTQFRKRDRRFRDAGRHRLSVDRNKARYARKRFQAGDFVHDKKTDTLRCPAGKVLRCVNPRFRNTSGLIGPQYRARMEDCGACPYKRKCRIGHTPRSVTLFRYRDPDTPVSFTERMRRIIDSPRGRYLYGRRMGIVEPVFGNLRNCLGLNRLSMRGRHKNGVQWMLYTMIHNMFKLYRYAPACCG